MSNQIKRNEIAEEGVLDNLLKPLKLLDEHLANSDKKLKDFAQTIEKSLNFGEKSKEIREFTEAEKQLNTVYEQKKKIDKDRKSVMTELEKAQERLKKVTSDEAKEVAELNEKIRLKRKELRDQAKGIKGTGDAYDELVKSTRNAKNEAKELGAQLKLLEREVKGNTDQYRQLSEQYTEVAGRAAKMDKELEEVDKTVGDNFRNVGNYESAFNALNDEVAKGGMEFRDLRRKIQEYQSIAVKAGRTSPIGQKAIKEASKLQDELDTLTAQTKALADDGANLKAALQLGEVVASSYQSVMAAQQLLGVESERVLEVMAKIQALQVIINNLNKIQASTEKATALAVKTKNIALRAQTFIMGAQTKATKLATNAMRALRASMLAVPFVAIIAGVTALASKFSDTSEEADDAKDSLDNFKDTDLSKIVSQVERMRAGFKGIKDEIRQIQREQSMLGISTSQSLNKQRELAQEIVDVNERQLEALFGQEHSLEDIRRALVVINRAQGGYIDNFEEYTQAVELFTDAGGKLNEDLVNQAREAITQHDEATKIIFDINKEFNDKAKKQRDDNYDEIKKDLEKQSQDRAEFFERLTKAQDEAQQDLIDREQREINEVREKYQFLELEAEKYIKDEEQRADELKVLAERRQRDIAEIESKFEEERENSRKEALQKELAEKENELERENMLIEKSNIENAKTQEEFDKMELERQKEHLKKLIELRQEYGEDTTDLQVQLAQLNQNFEESTNNTIKELVNGLDKFFQDFTARQQAELQQQERNAAQLYGTLEKFAAEGNLQAEESLTEMLELQQQAQREQIRLQQRQQRIEQARQVYSIIQSQLDAGKSPGEAIASTGGYMTAIQGLISSLPSFYEGTEDTGKVGKALDNKGGRLSILHDNERVIPKHINAELNDIPNQMLPYLVSKGLDHAGNTYDVMLLEEIQRTRSAIENMPNTDYQVRKVLGEFAGLLATTKKGNSKTKNLYN